MFVGAEDDLADVEDTRWLKSELGKSVIHYEEMPTSGHVSFMIAKDMTYFSDRVMGLIKQYNQYTQ